MNYPLFYKIIAIFFGILLLYLAIKFAIPLFLPFLLGGLLSLAAEPFVRFGCRKLHLSRTLSALIGVSLTLAITVCLALAVGMLAFKEVKSIANLLPDLQDTARDGIATLQQSLMSLSQKAPQAVRSVLERSITNVLSDGEGLLELSSQKLPVLVGSLMEKIPGSALSVGTGILASFLISARLPRLKEAVHSHIPKKYLETWLPAWRRIRKTAGKWLLAQSKLMLVTWGIVTAGLWLLNIPYAPAWAALTALVDAVPLLGTGIVLVPWALVKLMQKEHFTAIGLLCTYAAAMVTRTVLEPRLVGKQLGLDPLATLIAIYIGYRLWGFWGLILAPVTVSIVIAGRMERTAE